MEHLSLVNNVLVGNEHAAVELRGEVTDEFFAATYVFKSK
jgi:hypothetical protein